MPRFTEKQYQRRVLAAGAIYVALMLLVWPMARAAGTPLPTKALLSMTPVLPMLYIIGQAARRIRQSDELEQRTHLIGLGVATAFIAMFSLVSGFLAAAKLLPAEVMAVLLIWIFPLLMICYGITRWWVTRHYGISMACDDEEGMPLYLRLLLATVTMGAVTLFGYRHSDGFGRGFLVGTTGSLVVFSVITGFRRWQAWRKRDEPGDPSSGGRH